MSVIKSTMINLSAIKHEMTNENASNGWFYHVLFEV